MHEFNQIPIQTSTSQECANVLQQGLNAFLKNTITCMIEKQASLESFHELEKEHVQFALELEPTLSRGETLLNETATLYK